MFANHGETGVETGSTHDPDRSDGSGVESVHRVDQRWTRITAFCVVFFILPAGIAAATYFQQGFVAAGRGVTTMAMPVGVAWLVLWAIMIAAFSRRRWSIAGISGLLFLAWTIVGSGWFANLMIRSVEVPLVRSPHPAIEQRFDERSNLDVVVSLGGSASLVMDDFVELTGDGERLVSAAQAFHAGKTRTIITTGSSTDGIGNPSRIGKQFLISLGVPATRVFEIEGVNTKAEMASLADFLSNPPASFTDQIERAATPRVGLMTSAYHMRRAMRLARDQGLAMVPLPCAFRSSDIQRPWKATDCIPTADAQNTAGLAIKEWLARLLGR